MHAGGSEEEAQRCNRRLRLGPTCGRPASLWRSRAAVSMYRGMTDSSPSPCRTSRGSRWLHCDIPDHCMGRCPIPSCTLLYAFEHRSVAVLRLSLFTLLITTTTIPRSVSRPEAEHPLRLPFTASAEHLQHGAFLCPVASFPLCDIPSRLTLTPRRLRLISRPSATTRLST